MESKSLTKKNITSQLNESNFLDSLSLSDNTINNYRNCYKNLAQFLGMRRREYLKALKFFISGFDGNSHTNNMNANKVFREFSKWLYEHKKLKKQTIELHQSALKEAVRELNRAGLISWLLTERNIRISSIERETSVEALDLNEIERILDYVDNSRNDFIGIRNRAIIYILLYTGIRRNELVSLKVNDVNLSEKKINIKRKGAGDKRVWKIIPDTAWLAFEKYHELHSRWLDSEPVWLSADPAKKSCTKGLTRESVSRIVKNIGDTLGIPLHTHRFRHTFATVAAEETDWNLGKVQEVTGHKSTEILRRYLKKENRKQIEITLTKQIEERINNDRTNTNN